MCRVNDAIAMGALIVFSGIMILGISYWVYVAFSYVLKIVKKFL